MQYGTQGEDPGSHRRPPHGDVIALDVDENIQVEVDGVPVMECKYGASNGQYALRVEKMLASEQGEPLTGGKNHG